jgi:outer membrane protein OmpA-like peptidoglycan-associated protein
MKKLFLGFLISISFISNAQITPEKPKSRLKLSPYFGLGIKLPQKQEIISGNNQLTQLFSVSQTGKIIDVNGVEKTSYLSTNRIGLNLGFNLTDQFEIHLGVNRVSVINTYKFPYLIDFNNYNIESNVDRIVFLNTTAGLKYELKNKYWLNLEGQYTPDYNLATRINYNNEIKPNVTWVSPNGDKVEFVYSKNIPTLASIYFGVGKKVIFDLNVELGLNIGLSPVRTYDVNFYERGSNTGRSRITETSSAIFLSVQQPINLGFKKRVKTPKPPKPEKVKTPKKEKEVPKPKEKESYEFKDKVIFKGDDIVLDNIKFDQSKSDLLLPGMKELDAVFELLSKYPDTKVALTGHTSQEGNRKDNINLSEDRAKACKSYLVKKGIKSSRIQAFGVGPDKPVSTTNTELNRRVEIKIF